MYWFHQKTSNQSDRNSKHLKNLSYTTIVIVMVIRDREIVRCCICIVVLGRLAEEGKQGWASQANTPVYAAIKSLTRLSGFQVES